MSLKREGLVRRSFGDTNATAKTYHYILHGLEANGKRLTVPRHEIARTLAKRADNFVAEEVVAALPDLGRATVYRTIRLFLEIGVLYRVVAANGQHRYSLANASNQYLVCVVCRRLTEFRIPEIDSVLQAWDSDAGIELVGHRLEVFHRCSACQSSQG